MQASRFQSKDKYNIKISHYYVVLCPIFFFFFNSGSGERKDIFTAGVVGTCDRISRGWGGRAAAGAGATAAAAAAAAVAAVPMVDYFRNSSASSSTLRRVHNRAPHH